MSGFSGIMICFPDEQGDRIVYAVIEDSGQQFRAAEGDVLNVDLRDMEEGLKEIEFDHFNGPLKINGRVSISDKVNYQVRLA